jgi:hypothetical protein
METGNPGEQVTSATPGELALVIFDVVKAGARVINLNVALLRESARG